ncbi:zinc ion-binding protein, putative [Medicago truncatula]|uniref:Zinc ion-binding protein, putative n=1 Tax=Medicago truncatula TaxID=3880 RepID=A0A072UFK3_MEDTR|nr:zinc ion-binding protein, putative [Medicago truncatula]
MALFRLKLQSILIVKLSSVKDAFDKVTKKQKLSSSKPQEMIDPIRQEIELCFDTDYVLDYNSVLIELN